MNSENQRKHLSALVSRVTHSHGSEPGIAPCFLVPGNHSQRELKPRETDPSQFVYTLPEESISPAQYPWASWRETKDCLLITIIKAQRLMQFTWVGFQIWDMIISANTCGLGFWFIMDCLVLSETLLDGWSTAQKIFMHGAALQLAFCFILIF